MSDGAFTGVRPYKRDLNPEICCAKVKIFLTFAHFVEKKLNYGCKLSLI